MADLVRDCPPKPPRGEVWLEGRQRRADRKAREDREMAAAKRRDGNVCRWPRCEVMRKEPRIEAAHVFEHRKMGGDRTETSERTRRNQLMGLCVVHHGRVDRQGWEVEAETANGTDGPCSFYRPNPETGRREHVATETRIGVSVRRGR